MVATHVLKGGGAFLLLFRNNGKSDYRLLLRRDSFISCYSRVKENWKEVRLSAFGSLRSITAAAEAAFRGRRVYCTAFQDVVDSSSDPPKTSSSNDEVSDSQMSIKDAANALDIRVGLVVKAWRHPEADSLYVEEVDVGEPQPRIICSGLVNYLPLDRLQDKKVVVLANLKPRNMRGIKSYGMLMAASDASHEIVELLVPPEASIPGERIWFGFIGEEENIPDAATPNQIQKKKIWEIVQPHLNTDASCVAKLGVYFMRTSTGVVVCKTLKDANIS